MKRNAYTPDEKAKMVLETLRGERTVNEIASAHNIYPNMLSRWKREAENNLYTLFQDDAAKKRKEEKAHEEELQSLYAKIGQLTTQNEWLKKKLACEMSVPERKALIETDSAELPVSTQAELLGLNRSGLYYKPVAHSEEDLKIKRMIDELYTAHPEFGYRRMFVWLNKEKKLGINHKKPYSQTLQQSMKMRNLKHGKSGRNGNFVIFAQAAGMVEPAESAFDNPASR